MTPTWPDLLLEWYRRRRRDLPWRRTRDPYHIWVSEVMLQQTRVETVIPYYERWIRRFPTLSDLAAAAEDEVLEAWAGLGYYSRVRNLHRAARQVAAAYGGRVPDDPEQFAALPGVGPYIAGAVQSIAFGHPVPAVDGNVLRVIARLYALPDDITLPATRRKVEGLLRGVIPAGAAGDFNQALMELGATVCVPGLPRCGECPVAACCQARAAGRERELPVRSPRAAPRPVAVATAVVTDGGRVLVRRRPRRGLLAGMWEFPTVEVPAGTEGERHLTGWLAAELGLRVTVTGVLPAVEHAFTHRCWHLTPYLCRPTAESLRPPDGPDLRWLLPGELDGFGLPAVFRKVAEVWRRREGG